MGKPLPAEIDLSLRKNLSHLIFQSPPPGLLGKVSGYLTEKGIAIVERREVLDSSRVRWVIVSMPRINISPLVLDLIESGVAEDVVGINGSPVGDGGALGRK
jgi:hypothetical protein